MKYVILPTIKIIAAIILSLWMAVIFFVCQLFYSIWNMTTKKVYLNPFEFDLNGDYLEDDEKDPKKIYKTPFHWALESFVVESKKVDDVVLLEEDLF